MAETIVSLKSVVKHFESLPDPRHDINRLHLLGDVIAIAVCGIIVGCDGPSTIAQWASSKPKSKWLKTVLELPNGIPSRDCIRRILTTLKPEAFQAAFASWIASLVNADAIVEPIIAIDGKTMRRSHDRSDGLGPLHMVSAWSTENGLTLGQIATEEKSNEITAIPELIDRLDVKDAIVTVDAMGCQKKIAKKIVDSQADYVLAVKDNQPKLHEAIKDIFSEEREGDLLQMQVRQHQTSEKGHGREDEHCYVLARIPDDFPMKDGWPGLKAIGMAVRVSTKPDGSTSCDVRYYIVSRFLSGKRFAEAVRGHWGIENSLHWVLDVSFNEDQSRTRKRFIANNLSWLRRFAISLLKRHPSKHSIIGKSRICGWDDGFLMEVLMAQGV
jgi:predicted transposase YbfD/YdcC